MNCFKINISAVLLLVVIAGIGAGLVAWKHAVTLEASAAATNQPEPRESVTVAIAKAFEHRQETTAIGTILALRSITLRNELAGTVRQVLFAPGQIVEAGAVLVRLDVSVETAELKAQEAQAELSRTTLKRVQQAYRNRAISEVEVDRAAAERDIARANIVRIQATIARKTIRAPFRARVGLADIHPGQYLNEGTWLTTLQGVDDAVHVDFAVAQQVALGLQVGHTVDVFVTEWAAPIAARIAALDARIDPATRNAMVRARIEGADRAPAPGASVRVRVPVGPVRKAVAVPVSALRKGPEGDHVFVIAPDSHGEPRAHRRQVESGTLLGDEITVYAGLSAGEQVAAAGAFKLRENVLVAVTDGPQASQ